MPVLRTHEYISQCCSPSMRHAHTRKGKHPCAVMQATHALLHCASFVMPHAARDGQSRRHWCVLTSCAQGANPVRTT
eukprot:3040753-Alexandrium_andersonii.AAC.1